MLSEELRAWLTLAMPGMVATAGDTRQPESVRLWAVRPREPGDVIEVYVLRSGSPRFFESLAIGKRAAANVIELPSYRSRTFKGGCALSEQEVDTAFIEERLQALGRTLSTVGMPDNAVQQMLSHSPRIRGARLAQERTGADRADNRERRS